MITNGPGHITTGIAGISIAITYPPLVPVTGFVAGGIELTIEGKFKLMQNAAPDARKMVIDKNAIETDAFEQAIDDLDTRGDNAAQFKRYEQHVKTQTGQAMTTVQKRLFKAKIIIKLANVK